jgi:hypothetical protein
MPRLDPQTGGCARVWPRTFRTAEESRVSVRRRLAERTFQPVLSEPASADLQVPIVVVEQNGAPSKTSRPPFEAEGLDRLTDWHGGLPIANQLPVLKPKAYLPVH